MVDTVHVLMSQGINKVRFLMGLILQLLLPSQLQICEPQFLHHHHHHHHHPHSPHYRHHYLMNLPRSMTNPHR